MVQGGKEGCLQTGAKIHTPMLTAPGPALNDPQVVLENYEVTERRECKLQTGQLGCTQILSSGMKDVVPHCCWGPAER